MRTGDEPAIDLKWASTRSVDVCKQTPEEAP
jgi:hypothetical protein